MFPVVTCGTQRREQIERLDRAFRHVEVTNNATLDTSAQLKSCLRVMQRCRTPQASLLPPESVRRRDRAALRSLVIGKSHAAGRFGHKRRNCKVATRMAHTVFVYGTLLSEEIVKILLNRNPESHAGTPRLLCCALQGCKYLSQCHDLQRRSKVIADIGYKAVYIQRSYQHYHRTS